MTKSPADDLVERLKAAANGFGSLKTDLGDFGLCDEAAARIRSLEAQRDEAVGLIEDIVITSALNPRQYARLDALRARLKEKDHE